MSILFWAFLAGTAAVALPLVFHLIRRTPRGRHQFSSLMFLKPTPPRLTRRSRLDQWLLLLLRALAIVLLAAAFMRPLWRFGTQVSIDTVRGRRVAILVDTSASMRRGDLWPQAIAEVKEVLANLEPADDVALFTFDDDVQAIVGFDTKSDVARNRKRALVRRRLAGLGPSWSHTDLGASLITVCDALDAANDAEKSAAALQVVVISDMQEGAKLEALHAYQWPDNVHVALHAVSLKDNSNASVQLIANQEEDQPGDEPRVRVKNSLDSKIDQFHVSWSGDGSQEPADGGVAFYVPPGQSRVLRVPRSAASFKSDRLVLQGGGAGFDDIYYVLPTRQQEVRLAYIGNDSEDDAQGLLRYLKDVFSDTARRAFVFDLHRSGAPLTILEDQLPDLVVVADAVTAQQRDAVAGYAKAGGTVLVVLKDSEVGPSLGDLLEGAKIDPEDSEPSGSDYAMLGEIDFSHPIFSAFATPRYNDFTKVLFWRHRKVVFDDDSTAHVIARFDNGDPAIWEPSHAAGRVVVMASGWHPKDSVLARLTKFVPMLEGVLSHSAGPGFDSQSYTVDDSVPLPDRSTKTNRVVIKPDGSEFKLSREATAFDQTDQPGIYTLRLDGEEHRLAVNLAARESDTAPMDASRLEQLGVKLGNQAPRSTEYARLTQLRDAELEGRQKFWKWLILAALCVLGLETCLAGWRARQASQASGEGE